MGTTRAGGLYYVNGLAVDSDGKPVSGAPPQPKDHVEIATTSKSMEQMIADGIAAGIAQIEASKASAKKPDTKADAKAEAKAETKAETKDEDKSGDKSDVKDAK